MVNPHTHVILKGQIYNKLQKIVIVDLFCQTHTGRSCRKKFYLVYLLALLHNAKYCIVQLN